MPIFRFLSLGNETPNLVFETQKRLVFLGLKPRNSQKWPITCFSTPSWAPGTSKKREGPPGAAENGVFGKILLKNRSTWWQNWMLTHFAYLLGYSRKKSQPIQTFLGPARSIFVLGIEFCLKKYTKFLCLHSFLIVLIQWKCPCHSVFIKSTYFFLSGTWIHFSKGFGGSKGPEFEKTTPGGPWAAPTPLTLEGLKNSFWWI